MCIECYYYTIFGLGRARNDANTRERHQCRNKTQHLGKSAPVSILYRDIPSTITPTIKDASGTESDIRNLSQHEPATGLTSHLPRSNTSTTQDQDAVPVRSHKGSVASLMRIKSVRDPWTEAMNSYFYKAAPISKVFLKATTVLTGKGFTRENTLLAHSLCRDEINKNSIGLFEQYWGDAFDFSGLSGFPSGGLTAFQAYVSHMKPEGRLVILYGPHVGITSEGKLGYVQRKGQRMTSCCDALMNVLERMKKQERQQQLGSKRSSLNTLFDPFEATYSSQGQLQLNGQAVGADPSSSSLNVESSLFESFDSLAAEECLFESFDPYDAESCLIELLYSEQDRKRVLASESDDEAILEVTNTMYRLISNTMHRIIDLVEPTQTVALLGGVQINGGPTGDYFQIRNFEIIGDTTTTIDSPRA